MFLMFFPYIRGEGLISGIQKMYGKQSENKTYFVSLQRHIRNFKETDKKNIGGEVRGWPEHFELWQIKNTWHIYSGLFPVSE